MSQDRIVNKKQNILIVVAFTLLVVIICVASFGMTAVFRNAANTNIEENAKDILIQSTKNIADYTDDFVGHGGGDRIMFIELLDYILTGNKTVSLTTIDESVISHEMAFKAEKSRISEGKVENITHKL